MTDSMDREGGNVCKMHGGLVEWYRPKNHEFWEASLTHGVLWLILSKSSQPCRLWQVLLAIYSASSYWLP